jgi:GAF domain-containing protein
MTPDLDRAFALAAGPMAAMSVFAYAREGLAATVGSLLTTATIYDVARMRSRRVWTDDATAYPTGNYKLLIRNRYFETVIESKAPFSSTSIEEIATVFFDWEKIQALGFESNMNLPAIVNGEVIGTINLLHRKGHFTPDRVTMALAWQKIATLAFLLLHREGPETATFHGGEVSATEGAIEG